MLLVIFIVSESSMALVTKICWWVADSMSSQVVTFEIFNRQIDFITYDTMGVTIRGINDLIHVEGSETTETKDGILFPFIDGTRVVASKSTHPSPVGHTG